MLVATRSQPVSHYDNKTDGLHRTKNPPLIPPTTLPNYFNVPFAIQHGYFRCIRYLLQLSYDPNERDSQLRTPLILCSYVEDDRWCLSLAQNLLEKGAKVALEDHARRNALHHACALQRINLVQLYLSCLDYKIEAKDSEGNTCLHYVAITGNCEIAELLIKAAEKIDVRLDQYLNRDGCSAAVLALKYGHIECANQITHRDWDEFFVVPRPLSIYETPPRTDDAHTLVTTTITTTTTATSKKRSRITSHPPSSVKNDIRPSTLSFGLLKIIFNENDTSYSTRLAGACKEGKQMHRRRRFKHKKQESLNKNTGMNTIKPEIPDSTHYCSTEAIVNEVQTMPAGNDRRITFDESEEAGNSTRASPRVQLLMQQHLANKVRLSNKVGSFGDDESIDEMKSKKLDRQPSISTLSCADPTVSALYDSPRVKNTAQRPKTAVVTRDVTSVNAVGFPSRLSSPKVLVKPSAKHSKDKSSVSSRPHSASVVNKQQQNSSLASQISSYSQTLYAGRPLSAVLQNHQRHPLPSQRTVDSSCSIREAKGASNRFNKPEQLFGIKPEELFGSQEHQPVIVSNRSKRSSSQKQPPYMWQQEVNKLADLFNIHHSTNYRPSAVPPPPPQPTTEEDTITDLTSIGRPRRMSTSKPFLNGSRSSLNPKQSTFAALNLPQRNAISRRPSIRLPNT